jgi:hypothetical protein
MRGKATLSIAAVLLVTMIAPAYADDFENSLRDGAWALQFGIGNDFRLTNFEGSSIALKRHFSDRSAVRAIVDFDLWGGESDDGANSRVTSESEYDRWDVDLTLLYQRYFAVTGRTAMFFGVGPRWGYESRQDDDVTTYAATDSTDMLITMRKREQDEWRIGGSVVVGGEWFASKAISLHAEYLAVILYRSATFWQADWVDGIVTSVNESDSSSWSVNQGTVRFGLSVYF